MTPSTARAAPAALLLALLAACAHLPGHADSPAPIVRGPIPSRVQQPIKLTYLAFRPRRAVIEPQGTTRLSVLTAYTNIFEDGNSASDDVLIDGEIWRTSLVARRAVSPSVDVEVELPVVYATSGFLDSVVESFHSFFGFPNSGRDERPDFAYDMSVSHDGIEAYHMTGNEPGLGDVPIVVTTSVLDEGPSTPAVAVRAGVELPTGSEDDGFGNGALDWGLGVLAERSFGRWTATGAVDYVDARSSSAFEDAGLEAQDDLDLQLGVEYRWNDDLSLLVGAVYNEPSTRDIDIEEIDGATLMLDFGAAVDLGPSSRLQVGFAEDLISASGPDFTVRAGWTISL